MSPSPSSSRPQSALGLLPGGKQPTCDQSVATCTGSPTRARSGTESVGTRTSYRNSREAPRRGTRRAGDGRRGCERSDRPGALQRGRPARPARSLRASECPACSSRATAARPGTADLHGLLGAAAPAAAPSRRQPRPAACPRSATSARCPTTTRTARSPTVTPRSSSGRRQKPTARSRGTNSVSTTPTSRRRSRATPASTATRPSRVSHTRPETPWPADELGWPAPGIVTKQNSALFSASEQLCGRQRRSSPYCGNVYVCKSGSAAPRGCDRCCSHARPMAATAAARQLTTATNNGQTGGSGLRDPTDRGIVVGDLGGFDHQRQTDEVHQLRNVQVGGTRATAGRSSTSPASGADRRRRRPDQPTGSLGHDEHVRVDIANDHPPVPTPPTRSWSRGPTTGRAQQRAGLPDPVDRRRQHLFGAATCPRPAIGPTSPRGDLARRGGRVRRLQRYLAPWRSTTASRRPMLGVVNYVSPTNEVTSLHRDAAATPAARAPTVSPRSSSVTTTTRSRLATPVSRSGTTSATLPTARPSTPTARRSWKTVRRR